MSHTWHDDAFFGLHFDIHALSEDRELWSEVSREQLVENFRKVSPDFIQCDSKGHPGYASYPTKVGIPAPHLQKDALKEWRAASKELGIPLVVHYSGINDAAVLTEHPDWGYISTPGGTCPLSPYDETYMIPQFRELLEDYDVDGLWVDAENWAAVPCCDRCTAEFRRRTGIQKIPTSPEDEKPGPLAGLLPGPL